MICKKFRYGILPSLTITALRGQPSRGDARTTRGNFARMASGNLNSLALRIIPSVLHTGRSRAGFVLDQRDSAWYSHLALRMKRRYRRRCPSPRVDHHENPVSLNQIASFVGVIHDPHLAD